MVKGTFEEKALKKRLNKNKSRVKKNFRSPKVFGGKSLTGAIMSIIFNIDFHFGATSVYTV